MKSKPIDAALAALALGLSACAPRTGGDAPLTSTQSGACMPSGQERYTLHLDGALSGIFEAVSAVPDGGERLVTFSQGLIFKGSFLRAWQEATRRPALLPEVHDVVIFGLSPQLEITRPIKELVDAQFVELEARTAPEEPRCLLVKSFVIKVRKIGPVEGTFTP